MNALIINTQTISQHNGLFSLNDLHKVSGSEEKHKPFRFLRNQQAQELISEIESENNIAYDTVIGKGKNQGTYVCEELVYAYAMWISAKFNLMVIRAFKALNTGAIPCLAKLTSEQAYQLSKAVKRKCQHNKLHYQTIYNALYDEFKVKSYKDISPADFEAAMAFIQGYQFVELYEVLAESATHLRQYAQMIAHLRRLPMVDENASWSMYQSITATYNQIVKLSKGMTNKLGEPMFEAGRINYYQGTSLILK